MYAYFTHVTLDLVIYPDVLNWSLDQEDPVLYLPSKLFESARREWPEVPYPQPEQPVAPSPTKPTHTDEELKQLLKIHHQFTKVILKMGVDPCKKFKEAKVESILARIKAKDLECPVCPKPFTSTSRMRQHITLKHLGVTKHQCQVCKKYYVNAQSLKAHESSHDEKLNPHKCTICGKAFPPQFKLSDHLPKHGEPMYVCQYENCGRKYRWLGGKKDHEKKCIYNEEAVDPPFKCEECGRSYWDKRSLDRHTSENHGDEPLQRLPCKQCDKTFKNKNSLDKHVKSVHQKKKPKGTDPTPGPSTE